VQVSKIFNGEIGVQRGYESGDSNMIIASDDDVINIYQEIQHNGRGFKNKQGIV
jgi:non-homologous end joining protein Ku